MRSLSGCVPGSYQPPALPTLRDSHNRESARRARAECSNCEQTAALAARGVGSKHSGRRLSASHSISRAYLLDGARSDVSERERLERVGLLRRECIGHDRPAIGVQRVQRAGGWHSTIEWSLCHACCDLASAGRWCRERTQSALRASAAARPRCRRRAAPRTPRPQRDGPHRRPVGQQWTVEPSTGARASQRRSARRCDCFAAVGRAPNRRPMKRALQARRDSLRRS